MTRYQYGTMTKLQLAEAFSSWNNDLLQSADSLVSDIKSSVIDKLTSAVDQQESVLVALYSDTLTKFAAVQQFMLTTDTVIEQFAMKLLIWQSPSTSFHAEQVLLCF